MIFPLLKHRQTQKIFRENREIFLLDTQKLSEEQNSSESLKEINRKKREEARRTAIETVLKKVKTPENFALLDEHKQKQLTKFTHSEISSVLETKGVNGAKISDILEQIDNTEAQQIAHFFAAHATHKNEKLSENDASLLTKNNPEIFLKRFVGNDQEKRVTYFSALQKLSPKNAETFAFVQTFETTDFQKFLLQKLSSSEKKIIIDLHQKANESQTQEIFDLLSFHQQNTIENATESAFEKTQEFSASEEILSEKNQKKEEEMLKIVQKSLGEHISKNIEKKISGEKTQKKRMQIFFKELQYHSQKEVKKLKKMETSEMLLSLENSRNFYGELIDLADFSETEKNALQKEISGIYEMFGHFFSAKNNSDFADFYAQNNALSQAESTDIKFIETSKAQLQEKLFELNADFSEKIAQINTNDRNAVAKSEDFRSLHDTYGVNIKKLRNFVQNGEPLSPHDFPHIREELHKMGFSSIKTINTLVIQPAKIHEAIDGKVIQKWHSFAKQNGNTEISEKLSPRVVAFYASSPDQKKDKMLKQFFSAERKIGNVFVQNTAEKTLNTDLKEKYLEKISPTFVQYQLKKVRNELQEMIEILAEESGPEAIKLKKIMRSELGNFPELSAQEIAEKNSEFSGTLLELMKNGADKYTILEGLKDMGSEDFIAALQDKKTALKKSRKNGTLEIFLKEQKLSIGRQKLKNIENSLPRKSIREQQAENFLKKITPLVGKLGQGNFSQNDIRKILEVPNHNGEPLVIPLSQTDKDIAQFTKESDAGIVFDTQSGHIIVSDELLEEMQEFPEKKHGRMLSHEMGHLIASQSQGEKILTQELKNMGIFSESEKKFWEIFSEKTGSASATEEIFSELLAAHQFGLDTFTSSDLGVGPEMDTLLRKIINTIGSENIQKILENSTKEFINAQKHRQSKIRVGEGSGLSLNEAQKKENTPHFDPTIETKSTEDCKIYTKGAGEGEEKDLEHPLDPRIWKKEQIDSIHRELNIRNLFKAIKKYKSTLPDYASEIDDYLEKGHENLKQIIEDINDQTLPMTESYIRSLTDKLDKLNDNAREVSNQLAQDLETNESPELIDYFWTNVRFLSMRDISEMTNTAYESIKRKLDTRAKRRRGEAGDSMFKGVWDTLANEFNKDIENAEKTEVGEIQEALDNKQTEDVYVYLTRATNPDEVKAGLQSLSGRGMINWDREEIHSALSRIGSGISFYKSDFDNPIIRDTKYKKAFTRVWGEEEMFMDIFNENDSNIQSQIGKYEKEASQNTGMVNVVRQMIKENRRGEFIDPNRYEGYISAMISDGKGSPSEAFFFLAYGVAVGLLPIQAFNRIDKHQNIYSLSNFLSDHNWTKEDAQIWIKEILHRGDGTFVKAEDLNPSMIDHWLYKNAFTESDVLERSVTNLSQRNHDHDNHLLLGMGTAEAGSAFLSTGSTGDLKIKQTAYPNALVGMMEYITSTAMQKDNIDKDKLRESVIRQAGYFSVFDGISSSKVNTKVKHKYGFTSNVYKETPRMGGMYNENMKVRDYIEAQKDIFTSVQSPDFKRLLQFAFDEKRVGRSKTLEEDWKNFLEQDENSRIKVAIEHTKTTSDPDVSKGGGVDFYEKTIPAIFDYFLDPEGVGESEAEKNLQSILSKANNISSGICNPKWANKKGDFRVKKEGNAPPPPPNRIFITKEILEKDIGGGKIKDLYSKE